MEIILLEKIQNVGNLGDTVSVKPGFARNYLIPQGKAVLVTPANIAEFEARRAELEGQQADALGAAQARAQALAGLAITIARKAGDEGRLFGSVGTQDVADTITESGIEVQRSEIRLPVENLRQTGEYEVGVHLHADVEAVVSLMIEAES